MSFLNLFPHQIEDSNEKSLPFQNIQKMSEVNTDVVSIVCIENCIIVILTGFLSNHTICKFSSGFNDTII